MERVALIYNPASGQISARRKAAIEESLGILRAAGVEAEAYVTDSAGSAGNLARLAMEAGCDAILACGGDGTVHEVLQAVAGTDVALGVVPLGTANALAANLGLAGKPARAVRKLLKAERIEIPVGRIHYQNGTGETHSRYFLVAAGAGADALLMSRLDAGLKRRLGYALYLWEAVRIWAAGALPLFEAVLPENGDGPARVLEVSQLLAVRVRSFGGVLNELAPGATLHNGKLRLLAFKTRSRLRYLRFLLAVVAGRHKFTGDIELLKTASIECRTRNGSKAQVLVEADGEVLGHLPVRMEVAHPTTVQLLVPPLARP
jgi:YegS/Rv2252/BmrU family lipid kinase